MAYIKTNWVNNETELNAQNMNHIEDGIEGAYGIPLLAVTDTAPAECETGDKYYDETTGKIYTATGHNTWGTTGEDPETGSFYIVFATQNVYTYDGQDLVSVGGGAGGQIAISETEPTEEEILWINPEDTPAGSLNPITNTYSEATDKGYSCNYTNGDVLYDNPTGATGNLTLSKAIENYKTFEVYFNTESDYTGIVKYFVHTGATYTLDKIRIDGSAFIVFQEKIQISGTTLTKLTNRSYSNTSGIVDDNKVKILKVIGYK
jgi:hypothetical protein